nr:metallophosphoesterase [Pseudonocardia acidicola]
MTAERRVTDLIASWKPNLVLYLGDVYAHGAPEEYANWYGENGSFYSRFRSITNPTPGNHEFESDRTGRPYYDYWGDPPPYYSYDTHGWHIITLDNVSPATVLSTSSAQYQWLAADLARHPDPCTLVTYHRPRFTEGRSETEGPSEAATDFDAFWRLIASHHVPLVLNGHSHNYQRWKPMDADGAVVGGGTTEFVVGTGGQWLSPLLVPDPRMAVGFDNATSAWGALQLQLSATGATYRFITEDGVTEDSGVVPCAGTVAPAPGP